MNRLTRNFAAILLSVTLLAIAAPAAQAFPLGKVPSGSAVDGSWFGAALSWLSQRLGIPQTPNSQASKEKTSTGAGTSSTTGGGFTGSCIDPNGCIVVDRGNGNGNGGK